MATRMVSHTHSTEITQRDSSSANPSIDISLNANVLAKELVWFTKLKKYNSGYNFLSYTPVYDKTQDSTALRLNAS